MGGGPRGEVDLPKVQRQVGQGVSAGRDVARQQLTQAAGTSILQLGATQSSATGERTTNNKRRTLAVKTDVNHNINSVHIF